MRCSTFAAALLLSACRADPAPPEVIVDSGPGVTMQSGVIVYSFADLNGSPGDVFVSLSIEPLSARFGGTLYTDPKSYLEPGAVYVRELVIEATDQLEYDLPVWRVSLRAEIEEPKGMMELDGLLHPSGEPQQGTTEMLVFYDYHGPITVDLWGQSATCEANVPCEAAVDGEMESFWFGFLESEATPAPSPTP